jgi:hypothetical protein
MTGFFFMSRDGRYSLAVGNKQGCLRKIYCCCTLIAEFSNQSAKTANPNQQAASESAKIRYDSAFTTGSLGQESRYHENAVPACIAQAIYFTQFFSGADPAGSAVMAKQ